jgi:hypothetical protein
MDQVISNADIQSPIETTSAFYSLLKYVIFLLIIGIILWIATNLGHILSYFGYKAAEVTKKTVNLSAEGSKAIVDVAANTINSGVNILEKGLKMDNKGVRNNIDNKKMNEEDQVFELLQNAKKHIAAPNEFEPHEASGMGFCYVGEDRGFRSCIKVGKADKCMSGDIFPTQDVCINPSLRA